MSITTENELKAVIVYTDGACLGNPGPGGYGAVLRYGTERKELSGGYRHTTNSRMEIIAVIKALEALDQPYQVNLFSDSKYVVNSISLGWAERWSAEDWMEKPSKPRKNADLWKQVLRLCEKHDVTAGWVKAHNGDPENERCDELAGSAAEMPNLPADLAYEKEMAKA
ncbi:MAG: ribonuclease HI [Candidatus Binatia bacterium]